MKKYTFFELYPHEAEHFPTNVNLPVSFRPVTISSRVLFWSSSYLSDS
jgi:hypothetical protein